MDRACKDNKYRILRKVKFIMKSYVFYIRKLLEKCHLFWLYQLNVWVSKKNYPSLACIPDDHIGREIIVKGLHEEGLLNFLFKKMLVSWISEFKTGVILDVGANIGNHTCFFARYFQHVIAFEPNPVAYRLLQANLALNRLKNVSLIKVGLSDLAADHNFVQTRGNLGGSGFFEADKTRNDDQFILRVEVGDSEIIKLNLNEPIRMIKVDVEGFEYPVLKGLKDTIAANKPILMFEIHPFGGDKGKAIFDYLQELGYSYFYAVEQPNLSETSKSLIGKAMAFFQVDGDYMYSRIYSPENRLYMAVIAYTKSIS